MVTNCTLITKTSSLKNEVTSPVKNAIIASSVKLGWILVNKKIISQAQLESVLTAQFRSDKKLGELLVEQKLISRKQLEQALKEQYWRRNGFWVI